MIAVNARLTSRGYCCTMPQTVQRFGFCFALLAFVASLAYCVAQVAQIAGLLVWPWDEILIYAASLGIAWPFMLAMVALHYATPESRKVWSAAGALSAVLYAGYAALVYVLQLGTAVPLHLQGVPNPAFAMDRYALSWTLDAMAYITMGLAMLFAAQAFPAEDRPIRWFFRANGCFTAVVALVYFYPTFSVGLLLLASPWMVTAPGSLLLLTRWFARGHGS